jgi:hypothetical protein
MRQVNSHKRQVRLRPSSNYFLFLFLPFFTQSFFLSNTSERFLNRSNWSKSLLLRGWVGFMLKIQPHHLMLDEEMNLIVAITGMGMSSKNTIVV